MKQLTTLLAALLGLVIVGIVVLVALGHPVPGILETIALVIAGGQAGATLPSVLTPATAATLSLPTAAAAIPTSPAPVTTTTPALTIADTVSPTISYPQASTPPAPATITSQGVTTTYPPAAQ